MTRAAILVCALAACHAAKSPAVDPYANKPLKIEVLLDEPMARSAHMGGLIDQLAITPNHLAMIADREKQYVVGWGGAAPVKDMPAFDAFEYTPDGVLFAVNGKQLYYIDSDAHLQRLFDLPNAGMGIAQGTSTMLIYDRAPTSGHPALYEVDTGKRVRKLMDAPKPIDAVARGGSHLFFVVAGVVFEATPGDHMRVLASLPGTQPIRYLTANADGSRVFVSDGDSIYVIEGSRVALVTRDVGGVLRMQDDALLVLDHKRRLLARLVGF